MKLDEIIVTSASAEIPKDYAESFLAKLDEKSTLVTKISSTLELTKVEHNFYVLAKNGKSQGWLELDTPVSIKGTKYDVIKIIYMIPEIRQTFAVGAFLIALKNNLPNPLILGSDKYGGVLFKDGEKLVKQLNKSARFDVKYLDLETGNKTEFSDLRQKKNETLIFECLEFPLSVPVMDNSYDIFIFEGSELNN